MGRKFPTIETVGKTPKGTTISSEGSPTAHLDYTVPAPNTCITEWGVPQSRWTFANSKGALSL